MAAARAAEGCRGCGEDGVTKRLLKNMRRAGEH